MPWLLKREDFLVYEYDQLSKDKRAAIERLTGVPLSGEFSSIQVSQAEDEASQDGHSEGENEEVSQEELSQAEVEEVSQEETPKTK